MIHNIWSTIEIYCNNRHAEPIVMEIQQGPHSLFYACPKYHPEHRETYEQACANRINLIEYESMIDYISKLIMESEMNNCTANLENYTWSKKGVEYKIFSHTKDKIKVLMYNKKAAQGGFTLC